MANSCGFAGTARFGLLVLALWSAAALGDTTTSLGTRSGEGSTAFTGLAQTPEANLFTGASGTSMAIEVPPGRKNVTPKLVLQYSSSGGPSPYGFGWDLPLGRIQRSTKWGVPRACGTSYSLSGNACGSSSGCPAGESCIATDQFVLTLPTGTAELVATSAGATTYRPKIEEGYTQVTKDTVNNTWTVYDRSGLKYTFGDVAGARAGTDVNLFGTIALDGTCHFTAEWALTKVQDPDGNYLSITYNSWYNVLYPASIDYGGNLSASPNHFYHVVFTWEGRPDLIENNLGSGRAVMAARLTSITVKTDVPTADTLVRTYNFSYDAPPNGQSGYRSVLSQAQVSYGFLTLPAQTFAHAPSNAGLHSAQTVTAPPGITALRVTDTSQDVSRTLLDMNHDGIADIVNSSASSWTVYTKTSSGYSTAKTWTLPPTGLGHFGPNEFTYLRDVNVTTAPCTTDANGNFTHCSDRDTVDLNGDGVPDFIDASATPWVVYLGQLQPNPSGTLGGFTTGVVWAAPVPYLRVDTGQTLGNSTLDWNSRAVQDLIDMNGDGLPDLVVASTTTWQIYFNTGKGILSTALSVAAPGSLVLESSWGHTVGGPYSFTPNALMDMNGDGLPDLVATTPGDYQCGFSQGFYICYYTTAYLNVYYNTGEGFASPVVFRMPPLTAFRWSFDGNTYADLFDVNGDGLPDWVGVAPAGEGPSNLNNWNSQWYVALNEGRAFRALGTTTLYKMVTLPPPGGQVPVPYTAAAGLGPWTGAQGAIRQTTTGGNPQYTFIDLFDINGDGMLDRVNSNNSASWSMQVNQNSTRPNLLVGLQNGLMGTTTLGYAPSSTYDNTGGDGISDLPFITWVTTSIVQNDGTCAPPCSGHDLTATYLYQDGRLDAASREFRGFRAVYRGDADNNWSFNYFGQDTVSKGKVLEVDTYAGAYPNLVLARKEINSWQSASLANTRSTQLWLRERDSYTCDLLGGATCDTTVANALVLYSYNDQPDAYGNILHTYSIGRAGERQDTYVEYATPQGGSGYFVYDKPKHTYSTGTGTSGTVAEKWFLYDGLAYGQVGKGHLTRVETWLDQSYGTMPGACGQTPRSGSGACIVSRMTYDNGNPTYGNITQTVDGNGNVTTTVYDSNKLLYPYQETVYPGSEATLTTTTTTDFRWGKPTAITDPNNATTQYLYDYFGRLSQVIRPLDTQYSTQYQYGYASQLGQLSWVQVQQREPNQTGSSFSGTSVAQVPGYVTTTQYFDALGRRRHTATLRVVNGSPQQVIAGCTTYDAGGRVAAVYDPYVNGASGDPNILCTAASGITNPNNGVTTYDYLLNGGTKIDPLGRVHTVSKIDGKTVTTLYNGTQRTDIDEEGNSTITTVNDHGWVVSKAVYYGTSTLYTYTTNYYDGAGRVRLTQQNGNSNTNIRVWYDSLGRKIQMYDPDSAYWYYAYDFSGNLSYQNDPNANQHVQFCYDGINRVTKKFYYTNDAWQTVNCTTDAAALTYTYGSTSDGICPKRRLGRIAENGDVGTSRPSCLYYYTHYISTYISYNVMTSTHAPWPSPRCTRRPPPRHCPRHRAPPHLRRRR